MKVHYVDSEIQPLIADKIKDNSLTTRTAKKAVSDGSSSEASEKANEAVANGVVVPKEEPGLERH